MADHSRRGFLQTALTALGIVGVGGAMAACDGGGAPTPPPAPTPAPAPKPAEPTPAPPAEPAANAADANKVNPSDAMAKTLKYVEDVETMDKAGAPTFKEGSKCSNCQLFQGAEGDEWGGCTIFQGKQVKSTGWCASWAPKV